MCAHRFTMCVHPCGHSETRAYVPTVGGGMLPEPARMHTYTHTSTCARAHTVIHTSTCASAHTHFHTCACIHTVTHILQHVHTHRHTSTCVHAYTHTVTHASPWRGLSLSPHRVWMAGRWSAQFWVGAVWSVGCGGPIKQEKAQEGLSCPSPTTFLTTCPGLGQAAAADCTGARGL